MARAQRAPERLGLRPAPAAPYPRRRSVSTTWCRSPSSRSTCSSSNQRRPPLAHVGQRDHGLAVVHLGARVLRMARVGRVRRRRCSGLAARGRGPAPSAGTRRGSAGGRIVTTRIPPGRSPACSAARQRSCAALGEVREHRERVGEVERLVERQPLGEEVALRERRRHAVLRGTRRGSTRPDRSRSRRSGGTSRARKRVSRPQPQPKSSTRASASGGRPRVALAQQAVERRALLRPAATPDSAVPALLQRRRRARRAAARGCAGRRVYSCVSSSAHRSTSRPANSARCPARRRRRPPRSAPARRRGASASRRSRDPAEAAARPAPRPR